MLSDKWAQYTYYAVIDYLQLCIYSMDVHKN